MDTEFTLTQKRALAVATVIAILFGPVVMIVIVTTINVYLAVFKGVPIERPDQGEEKSKHDTLFGRLMRRLGSRQSATSTAE